MIKGTVQLIGDIDELGLSGIAVECRVDDLMELKENLLYKTVKIELDNPVICENRIHVLLKAAGETKCCVCKVDL
jgi:hypothetical protein